MDKEIIVDDWELEFDGEEYEDDDDYYDDRLECGCCACCGCSCDDYYDEDDEDFTFPEDYPTGECSVMNEGEKNE